MINGGESDKRKRIKNRNYQLWVVKRVYNGCTDSQRFRYGDRYLGFVTLSNKVLFWHLELCFSSFIDFIEEINFLLSISTTLQDSWIMNSNNAATVLEQVCCGSSTSQPKQEEGVMQRWNTQNHGWSAPILKNYHNEISLISQYEITLRTNGDIICFFLKKQKSFRRDLNNVLNCTQKALKRLLQNTFH